MKIAMKTLPALLALLCAGCISVLPEPKNAAPRFDVALPNAPAATGAGAVSAPQSVIVIGRIRSSEEAAGRAIRTVELATGRTGQLTDGELALSPEAIVGAFLRAGLSARHPDAIVCDASVAPRSGTRTTVDAWVERFRLEKHDASWFFTARIRILAERPDGTVTVADATPSVPVSTDKDARPTAAEAVQAISKALAKIQF